MDQNSLNGHTPPNGNGTGAPPNHKQSSRTTHNNGHPRYAHVVGWGMAVPTHVMTNDEISRMVNTSDEWIRERTGIRERRIAGPKDTTASLATWAAKDALDMARLGPHEIDLIIVSTATPEHQFPSTASIVQDWLGAENAGAFDLSAACSGFIFAMNMAAQAIRTGAVHNALVIGSETLSRITNWEDRSSCILFADGAGAVVLKADPTPGGFLAGVMHSDGSGGELLSLPGPGSRIPVSHDMIAQGLHKIHMNGREVFRFAARALADVTREALDKAGVDLKDIALIIPHQANLRIIEAAARGLHLPMDKFFINIERYGNTSSASIPIALCEAIQQGRIRKDDHIVMVGFGAGLTWGANVVHMMVTPEPVPSWWHTAREARYLAAGIRSTWRRQLRHAESRIMGPAAEPEKTTK